MRLSRYLLPTLKETPAEAQIVSHRYMLRAGMIRQASAGIYSWLPLGLRVLRRIEAIVREEQVKAGCHELLMPTIQPAELWQESGRYDDYGREMLRIRDRHERDMLYGPTNEELVTDIFRNAVQSYRELPQLLYHIQWKFRDEVRPRFGVMRGREFLMKDSYSFDLDFEGAKRSYNKMFVSYLRTFARLGLRAIPMEAETGPIGGNLSHEFIILADTGESEVFCHRDYVEHDVLAETVDYQADLEPIVRYWTSLYARTDDKHDAAVFEAEVPEDARVRRRGIEVGHIFYFGTKYSEPMGARVAAPDGQSVAVHMGSYGIIWPDAVAPYDVGLINLKSGDPDCDAACMEIYRQLQAAHKTVLYDDREERPGAKFATMDLIGLPWQVIVGPRGVQNRVVELKRRDTGERQELSVGSALAKLWSYLN